MRDRILNEATQFFTERGYQGISMREIAEAVGVSKAALYYHFQDKEALFLGVLLSSIAVLGRLVAEAGQEEGIRAQLHALLFGIATRMAGQRAMMRVAEQDAVHLSPEAQKQMRLAYQQAFTSQVRTLLEVAQGQGELRALDVGQLTRVLLGMAYPLLATKEEDAEATVKLVLSIFLEGAAPR